MSLFLPALPALCLGLALSASSGAAADDCLAGPNAPSPPGSHWYYRVDRATHQQCWYLGAENGHVRTQPRQAAAPARTPSPKASQRVAAPAAAPAATPQPLLATTAPPDGVTGTAKTVEQPGTPSALGTRWEDAPQAAVAIDAGSDGMRSGYAQEQPTLASDDEMPLIWPILTKEELAAADHSTQPAFAHLAGLFAAVMGIAALIGALLLRISIRRTPRRSPVAQRVSPHWSAPQHEAPSYEPPLYEPPVESEAPLAPSVHADYSPGAPDYSPSAPEDETELTVPQLLAQLRLRSYQDELHDLALAPAR